MTEHLPDLAKVFGVSSAGLAVANFSGLDAMLNTGILAITFLYGFTKLLVAIRDAVRGTKTTEKNKDETRN